EDDTESVAVQRLRQHVGIAEADVAPQSLRRMDDERIGTGVEITHETRPREIEQRAVTGGLLRSHSGTHACAVWVVFRPSRSLTLTSFLAHSRCRQGIGARAPVPPVRTERPTPQVDAAQRSANARWMRSPWASLSSDRKKHAVSEE